MERWRNIAVRAAEREGWHVLTECDHNAVSTVKYHNVEIFRFYHLSPASYLHLDICHGFVVWGLPLLTEKELLQGRMKHESGFFTHIDAAAENMQKIQQIYRLLKSGRCCEKIALYRKKILDCDVTNGNEFRQVLREKLSRFGEQALEALQAGDMGRFRKRMNLARLYFVTRYAVKHPFRAALNLCARSIYYLHIFVIRQCGFVLRIYAPEEEQRRQIREGLEKLSQANVLYRWTDKNAERSRISWHEHKVMGCGGLVIKWSEAENAQINITKMGKREDIVYAMMRLLIERHATLFCRGLDQP